MAILNTAILSLAVYCFSSYFLRCGELEAQCAKGVHLIMTLQQRLRKPTPAPAAPAPAAAAAALPAPPQDGANQGTPRPHATPTASAHLPSRTPGTAASLTGGVGGKGGLQQLLAALTKQKQEAARYSQVR